MGKKALVTDEQINTYFAEVLDVSLATDSDYQTLNISCQKATDALNALALPKEKWQIVDDYASASGACFAAYATAAYRLGFRDGREPKNLLSLEDSCLGVANLILDALEDDTVPISWQASKRSELAQTIASVLCDLSEGV